MTRLKTVSGFLFAGIVFGGCLPNPQSVAERREEFPRESLQGDILLDRVPAGATAVDAVFGGQLKLVAYEMDPPKPQPGDRVTVTFYWSAVSEIAEDYQVFVHGDAVGGKAGRLHGDHYPAKGKYPTDVWRTGEIIADPFSIWIPPSYGPKTLGLFVGMYKKSYRVPLSDKGKAPGGSDNRSQAVTIRFR